MPPPVTVVFGTEPGGSTMDQDRFGGNPFATALLELAANPSLTLEELLPRLRDLTAKRTRGLQKPGWSLPAGSGEWRFHLSPALGGERRIALVLVVSDYSATPLPSLRGAAVDERRMAAMLAGHVFTVFQTVPPGRRSILGALSRFAKATAGYDTALIYCTGHGVQLASKTYLVPGNFPARRSVTPRTILDHAIPIADIARSCRATRTNIAFFAGCRQVLQVDPDAAASRLR